MKAAFLISTGSLFIIVPLFYLGLWISMLVARWNTKLNPLLVACACMGPMYIHHAFSRADVNHLSQGSMPFVLAICMIALSAEDHNRTCRALCGVTLVLGALSIFVSQPAYQKWVSPPGEYRPYKVINDTLVVPGWQAEISDAYKNFNATVPPDEAILIAPHMVTMYPLLGRISPTRVLYYLLPESDSRQRRTIGEIEAADVRWAIIADIALDRREDRRFKNTFPLVMNYIDQNFEPVKAEGFPKDTTVYRRAIMQ